MKAISMLEHDFIKTNLVTENKGDHYRCKVCGCEGWRAGIAPIVRVTEEMAKVASKCKYQPPKPERPSKVLLGDMPFVGIKEGIHQVIECPEVYKERFEEDVWVWSESRKEAVRILPDEIIESEY